MDDSVTTAGIGAKGGAGIMVVVVSIVAFFIILDDGIATSGSLAGIAAFVLIDPVPVVAFLGSRPHDLVAALGEPARVGTAVIVDAVPVVTVLVAFVFGLEVLAQNTVATSGLRATGQAAVVFNAIAVIADFAILQDTVAAFGWSAIVTTVLGDVVTIVTALAGPPNAITTDVGLAIAFAGIVVIFVAIIAGLITGLIFAKPPAQHAIATAGLTTIVSAGVGLGLIPVVAILSWLKQTIATARQLAGIGAFVLIAVIAIIAGFDPHLEQAIAAFGWDAARNTGIFVVVVAIITALEA